MILDRKWTAIIIIETRGKKKVKRYCSGGGRHGAEKRKRR